MVNVVETHYTEIVTCLGEIYLGDDAWDGETCSLARGLHGFLLDFDTVFFLKMFSEVFSFTDLLYLTLQSKELDFVACNKSVNETKLSIKKLRSEEQFNKFLTSSLEITGVANERRHEYSRYFKIYCSLLDRIIAQLDTRFKDLHQFKHAALLDSSKFECFSNALPKELIDHFWDKFDFIDRVKLANELKVMYCKDDFKGKSVSEIVTFLCENNFEDIFSEVSRLGRQILSFPSTTASVERSFSVLRRIKNYLRNSMGEERLKWLMLMSVEQVLWIEL